MGLATASVTGLSYLIRQSQQAKDDVDGALRAALGPGYLDDLTAVHTDVDMATPWRQLAMPFRMQNPEVEVIKDVTYAGRGSRRGLLDVYRRAGTPVSGAPVLLQVHGGGWTIGNKDQQGIPLMLHMAARGWVCVAINYRLSPRHAFPTHLVDVKRSIAWIRKNIEEYGGDPSYIAITGGSAGGHLTALAALTPNDPEYQPGFEDADTTLQAAVPFYGVYDFAGATGDRRAVQMRDAFLGPRVLKKDPRSHLAEFEKASPLLRVNTDAPPFFVIHGTHDTLVPSRPGTSLRAPAARGDRKSRGLRRAARDAARVRRLPVDPQRPRDPRRGSLPALELRAPEGRHCPRVTPPRVRSGAGRGCVRRPRCGAPAWFRRRC